MKFNTADRPKEASFDLTPMIDVVLLLIIFFMLTSQFTRSEQLPMDLPPERGEGAASTSPTALVIDLDKDGKLAVLAQPLEWDDVPRVVGGAAAAEAASNGAGGTPGKGKEIDLTIRADRSCPAASLNRLAEMLARQGVRTWKLATAPQGPPGAAPGRATP